MGGCDFYGRRFAPIFPIDLAKLTKSLHYQKFSLRCLFVEKSPAPVGEPTSIGSAQASKMIVKCHTNLASTRVEGSFLQDQLGEYRREGQLTLTLEGHLSNGDDEQMSKPPPRIIVRISNCAHPKPSPSKKNTLFGKHTTFSSNIQTSARSLESKTTALMSARVMKQGSTGRANFKTRGNHSKNINCLLIDIVSLSKALPFCTEIEPVVGPPKKPLDSIIFFGIALLTSGGKEKLENKNTAEGMGQRAPGVRRLVTLSRLLAQQSSTTMYRYPAAANPFETKVSAAWGNG